MTPDKDHNLDYCVDLTCQECGHVIRLARFWNFRDADVFVELYERDILAYNLVCQECGEPYDYEDVNRVGSLPRIPVAIATKSIEDSQKGTTPLCLENDAVESLYAWHMGGEGDLLVVAATSVEEAKNLARNKIREIYIESLWGKKYQRLEIPCIQVATEQAIFLDGFDTEVFGVKVDAEEDA